MAIAVLVVVEMGVVQDAMDVLQNVGMHVLVVVRQPVKIIVVLDVLEVVLLDARLVVKVAQKIKGR